MNIKSKNQAKGIFRNNQRFFPNYISVDELFSQLVRRYSFPGAKILDFGSSRDFKINELQYEGIKTISIDVDWLGLRGNPNPLKALANGDTLPFKNASFDMVAFKYVFEHLERPQIVLAECRRCLKKGGYIIFLCPNKYSYISFLSRYTPLLFHKMIRRHVSGGPDVGTFPTHYKVNSIKRIKRLMSENKFKMIDLRSFVGYPTYWEFSNFLHIFFCFVHKILEKLPVRYFDISLIGVFQKGDT